MIVLAYGVPGAGKSTLLHDMVKAHEDTHRIFVHDHEAGWGADGVHWRNSPPKQLQIVQGESELDALEHLDANERPARGVFVFRNVESERILQLAVKWGDVVYVDDELDKAGRKKGFDDSALRAIVNEGRHLINDAGEPSQLHVLGACRRPQKLHTDITDLADEVYIFRCQGSRTLGRLKDDSMIEDEEEEEVRNLPNFHFLHWPSKKRMAVQSVG
jgi:hypothetical protein